jgi:hypothetical protein
VKRITTLLMCALMMLLASLPVVACSWGNPERRLQDEIHAYYDAEVVFLVRIGQVDTLSPEREFPQVMWSAAYQILEVYRGSPVSNGRLVSVNWTKPGLPGPMPLLPCSGPVVPPSYEGERMLVFGSQWEDKRDGLPLYGMMHASTLIGKCAGCEDVLGRLRLYARFHQVDLRPR